MSNGKDIKDGVRQVLTGEKGRAVIATAVGELIRNARVVRRPKSQPDPRPLISGLGGFAAGVGTASLVPATVRGIKKLVRAAPRVTALAEVPHNAAAQTRKAVGSSREAVDAFASKLGSTRSTRRQRPASGKPAGGTRSHSSQRSSGRASSGGGQKSASTPRRSGGGRSSGAQTPKSQATKASGSRASSNRRSGSNGNRRSTSAKAGRS